MKTGLKTPFEMRKSERKVRHRPVLSFDSRLAALLRFSTREVMGKGESKGFVVSDFCSEEGRHPNGGATGSPRSTSAPRLASLAGRYAHAIQVSNAALPRAEKS